VHPIDLLQQLAPVVFWQVQVEQNQVRPRRVFVGTAPVEEVQPLLPIAGDVQGVTDVVAFEGFPRDQFVPAIVFDQQDIDDSIL